MNRRGPMVIEIEGRGGLEKVLYEKANCRCENCTDETRAVSTDLLLLVNTLPNFQSDRVKHWIFEAALMWVAASTGMGGDE